MQHARHWLRWCYMFSMLPVERFASSMALTLLAMFGVGAVIANLRWWKAGCEMLGIGAVVAAIVDRA